MVYTLSMGMSAAEKQKEHRDSINNDPTKREGYLRKERLRWNKRVRTNKYNKKLSERDKRQKRRKLRKSKTTSRFIEKDTEKQRAMLEQNTPPQSDDDVNEQHRETRRHVGTEYTTSVR